jgi:VanZ family protein
MSDREVLILAGSMKIVSNSKLAAIPAILQMAAIFYTSSRPLPTSIAIFPDYLLHGFCYFVLCIFLFIAFRGFVPTCKFFTISVLAISVASVFGILDEIHQSFNPYRYATVSDAGADAGGALLALVLIVIFRMFLKQINPVQEATRGDSND